MDQLKASGDYAEPLTALRRYFCRKISLVSYGLIYQDVFIARFYRNPTKVIFLEMLHL